MTPPRRRVLILGGTGEGLALGRALADDPRFEITYSVAGRTTAPVLPPTETRTGGFGGVNGLQLYLEGREIDLIVDATHPFAAQMSANAVEAAAETGIPVLALRRPPWTADDGDRWIDVPIMQAAADAIGAESRRVFLTIGQHDLAPFLTAPQHRYVLRSVEPPPEKLRPLDCLVMAERGPFALDGERALLAEHRIDILVTKNSGGDATRPKLIAARERGIPVIMVARPALPPATAEVPDVDAALAWLDAAHGFVLPTDRGV